MRSLIVAGKQVLCPECLTDDQLVVQISVRAQYELNTTNGEPYIELERPMQVESGYGDEEDVVTCLAKDCMIDLKMPEGLKHR